MEDTELILGALRMAAPPPRKKKVIPEIEPSEIEEADENDPVWKLAKLCGKKRKPKHKPLQAWTSTDFMRYLDSSLKVYSLHLESATARDREVMSGLYDTMVRCLGDRMNNSVLKDYIDWWVAAYGPGFFGRKIYVSSLTQEFTLAKFYQRFDAIQDERKAPVVADTPKPVINKVDDETLYRMGGLPMLLMSRGIVAAGILLRKQGRTDWIIQLSDALRKFSKEVVLDVIEESIKNAPYNTSDMFDFISVARPTLQYYGIRNYDNLRYQEYFGTTK